VKEHNRARLALIDARFCKPRAPTDEIDFEAAFLRVCESIIRPAMEDVAEELEKLGHSPEVIVGPVDHEGSTIAPCIALHVGQRGREKTSGFVALGVAKDGPSKHVLAWLLAPPTPFDLDRHAHPDEIRADYMEQLLIDAVEHLFSRR